MSPILRKKGMVRITYKMEYDVKACDRNSAGRDTIFVVSKKTSLVLPNGGYVIPRLDQHSAGISSALYKEFDKDGDALIESDGKLAMLRQFMSLVLIVDAYGLLLSKLLLQWGKGEEIVNLHEVTEDPRTWKRKKKKSIFIQLAGQCYFYVFLGRLRSAGKFPCIINKSSSTW